MGFCVYRRVLFHMVPRNTRVSLERPISPVDVWRRARTIYTLGAAIAVVVLIVGILLYVPFVGTFFFCIVCCPQRLLITPLVL